MTVASSSRRLRHTMAVALSALCLVMGCTSPTPTGEAVPELRAMLSQVDRAIVDGRYVEARTLLNDIVDATVTARDDGALDSGHADRILAAAAGLLSALPRAEHRAVLGFETPDVAPTRSGDGGDQPFVPQDDVQSDEPRVEDEDLRHEDEVDTQDGDVVETDEGQTTKDEKEGKREGNAKKRAQKAQGRGK